MAAMSGFTWGQVTDPGSAAARNTTTPAPARHPRLTEDSRCACGAPATDWAGKPSCGPCLRPPGARGPGRSGGQRASAQGPWTDAPDPWSKT
jgi:hypothetical protein